MSPAGFSKTQLGRGERVNICSYHFNELVKYGLAEPAYRPSGGGEVTCSYVATEALTQSIVDAAALLAIANVLEGIPDALHQWFDGPYVEDVEVLVKKTGRQVEKNSGQ